MALIKGLKKNSAQVRNSIKHSMGQQPVRGAPTNQQKSEQRRLAGDPGKVYDKMSLPKKR